jgi:RNA polymerase sigma-70 factor (ECF subfamily)
MSDIRILKKDMTDKEILASFCTGDGSAFPILYERYAARGVRYAYSLLQSEYDSEEAVQEAFCRLLKPMAQGAVDASRGGFCALFFRTLRNLCIDMLRKKRHRSHIPLDMVAEPRARSEGTILEDEKVEKRIAELLEGLPANHGHALKLRLNAGLSYDQIAEVLGCTHSQVRTWIFRARRELEERLQREGYFDGKE